jgi:hypothetical protein
MLLQEDIGTTKQFILHSNLGKIVVTSSIPAALLPYLTATKRRTDQDMNPFSPDDRVQCKEKNRRHGTVLCIMCGKCEKCSIKPFSIENYKLCTAKVEDKNKVYVSYPDSNKRFKYDYIELEIEPPLPVKPPQKVYDLSAKDIRPLGDARISVPLIVSEDEENDDGAEEPFTQNEAIIENKQVVVSGMTFDTFLSFSRMERPI